MNRLLRLPTLAETIVLFFLVSFQPFRLCAQDTLEDLPGWKLQASLTIGSYDSPGYVLSGISDLAVDRQGRIFVLERTEAYASVYSKEGEFIRRLGRRGDGPGEFQMPFRMGFLGDSLWITDGRHHRVTFFGPDLEVMGSIPARSPLTPGLPPSAPSAILRDGTLAFQGTWTSTLMRDGRLPTLPVFLLPKDGDSVDTLAVLDYRKVYVLVEARGIVRPDQNPFAPKDEWAVSRDGVNLVLLQQYPDSIRITRISNGTARKEMSLPYGGTPLERSRIREWAEAHSARVGGNDLALAREYYDALLSIIGYPSRAPVVDAVLVENSGAVWLRLWEVPRRSAARTWIVLSPVLQPVGRVTLPPRTDLLDVQCHEILAATYDELDVPFVVRYSMVPAREWCDSLRLRH